MKLPEIYADFNNMDNDGRIRLTTVGSITDIARLGIQLRDGLKLILATDDVVEAARSINGAVHAAKKKRSAT